jgi:hypothetical protein
MQDLSGFDTVDEGCFYCRVALINVQLVDGRDAESYRCLTEASQEGDGLSGMAYDLLLPSYFVNANKAKLDSGVSTICIPGGSAVRGAFGEQDFVVIPPRTEITFAKGRTYRQRRLVQTGTRSVLAVRVTTPFSSPSATLDKFADSVFGAGGQQYSMASQYSACSFGKLSFVPGVGSGVTNGTIELALAQTIEGLNIRNIENSLVSELQVLLQVPNLDEFDNVIFCLPYGSTFTYSTGDSLGWIAYSFKPGKLSYYNNEWCTSLSAQMHEVGCVSVRFCVERMCAGFKCAHFWLSICRHNLGLAHSHENGIAYDDQTGMMGYSYGSSGAPAMCFNGHKNYVLGWYADKQINVEPLKGERWSGKLVGFVDYDKASTSQNEFVLIVVDQFYIQYNLAESFNFQTREHANMVTVTTASGSTVFSSMEVALAEGQTAVIGNYTIEVGKLVAANALTPKYVVVSIQQNIPTVSSPAPSTAAIPFTPPPNAVAMVTPSPSTGDSLTSRPTTSTAPNAFRFTTKAPSMTITSAPIASLPTAASPVTASPSTRRPSASLVTLAPRHETPFTPSPVATVSGYVNSFCRDSNSVATFPVHDINLRICDWISQSPDRAHLVCQQGSIAWQACEKTCGRCATTCNNNEAHAFYVSTLLGFRTCSWLEKRNIWMEKLCVEGNMVYDSICPKTCGRCQ